MSDVEEGTLSPYDDQNKMDLLARGHSYCKQLVMN